MTSNKQGQGGIPLTAIFFAIVLAGMTVVRFLQYSEVIDPHNGFFTHDGGFMNIAYYVNFAAATVLMLLFAIIDKRGKRGILSNSGKSLKEDIKTDLTVLLPEVALLDKDAGEGKNRRDSQDDTTIPSRAWKKHVPLTVGLGGALFTSFLGGGLLLRFWHAFMEGDTGWLRLFLFAAAGLGYTFVAYSVVAHRKLIPAAALAMLFIAGFSASEAAFEFMQRAYTANISSRLILLSVNLLYAVFLLSCGRIIVRSETRFTAYCATLSGYMGLGLIFSDFVARLVYYHTADSAVQETLTFYTAANGFELPGPEFIAQGFVVLWLIYVLSARHKGTNTEVEEIGENKEESVSESTENTESTAEN
jgi:hypothetical protein